VFEEEDELSNIEKAEENFLQWLATVGVLLTIGIVVAVITLVTWGVIVLMGVVAQQITAPYTTSHTQED